VDVDVDGVHTNIVMVKVVKPGLTPAEFCSRLDQVNFMCNLPHFCLIFLTECLLTATVVILRCTLEVLREHRHLPNASIIELLNDFCSAS